MNTQSKIALIGLPWHPFDYLSLQLGALAAYLRRGGITVDVLHYYRDFGAYIPYRVFSALHGGSHGEALFAAVLYPDRRAAIARQLVPALPADIDFDALVAVATRYLDDLVADRDWSDYAAVGFTLTHEQLMASMGLARRIKQAAPGIVSIVGGAQVLAAQAPGLLKVFPEIDLAICGEGEETFKEVAQRVLRGDDSWESVPGLAYRRDAQICTTLPRPLIESLDSLPYPDFADFFTHEVRPGCSKVVPRICVEISRGCSWGRCEFCNLSRQWGAAVRSKSPQRVAEEIAYLVQTCRSSRILICDTNVSAWKEAFVAIRELGLDLEIFAEVSVHLNRETLEAMRAAGVRSIQVGIESFSQHLLARYQKGARVMRNVEMLKWSAELGIQIGYNLIIRYPGETPADVEETLGVLNAIAPHFAPPSLVNYSLSFGSNAYHHPESHNILRHSIPEYYQQVYPPELVADIAPFLTLWVVPEPLRDPGTDWSQVESIIDAWRTDWSRNPDAKRLTWRDCEDFLIIDARPQPGEMARSWRLSGLHRQVYLACDREARNLSELAQALHAAEKEIVDVVTQLHQMKILFHHANRALALAIRDA